MFDNMNIQEDQAAGLRRTASGGTSPALPRNLRCIAVGSGKGGVGKTVVSVGLSYYLARMNYRVLLLDADLGLANVDLQIGLDPEFTLQDVVFGNCSLDDALVRMENGPDLLPSPSGAAEMVDMGGARRTMFVQSLIKFAANYDFLIIDVGAGIGKNITEFLSAAPEVFVVVANEPTSVMDAYSLIKCLNRGPSPPSMAIVVNMVRTLTEGEVLADRLNKITLRFLGLELPLGGIIIHDECVGNAIRARRPVVEYAPKSAPSRCIAELARFVAAPGPRVGRAGKLDGDFFDRLTDMGVLKSVEDAEVKR